MPTFPDIETLRNDTPGCHQFIHFNNAGSGLMPIPVLSAMKDHLDLESMIGGYEAADKQQQEIQKFYEVFGRLFNCPPENVAYSANATDAYSRALSSIPFQKGDVILTSNEDYISNQITFLAFKKRFGIDIIRIPFGISGGIDLEAAYDLIQKHRPKLVAITHVPTNSGLIQPVEKIGEFCKEFNVLYLVDACQSVGQMDVDVQKIGCDFLSGTSRKWLRGPRGSGFLFVSDKVLDMGLEPLWIDMRGAEWTGKDEYQPHKTAQRFEDWESPYALVLGTTAAAKYALKIGLDKIASRTQSLATGLRRKIESIKGLEIMDIGTDLCGIVSVAIPGKNGDAVGALLRKQNVNSGVSKKKWNWIDYDKKNVDWTLRLSPHYYNTELEINKVVELLEEITKQ